MYTATGKLSLSLDGSGSNNAGGAPIRVQKPAGATVRAAFLGAASTGFTGRVLVNGDVKLDGAPVTWSITRPSSIRSSNSWGDVTNIVKNKINAAPAGIVSFNVTEVNTYGIDGEALAVIFDDPGQTTDNTVALLFGAQTVGGDTFGVTFANPINKSDSHLLLDMSLGISFGYQSSTVLNQYSIVNVNGKRLTTAAGGQDDGQGENGALITVGGIGDSDANPANPFATPNSRDGDRSDDELYNLVPFVNNGDRSLSIFTQNPSNDDNIFFAGFFLRATTAIVGEGILLAPPTSTQAVGSSYTATATVQDNAGHPLSGRAVTFQVTSGPDTGMTASRVTDSSGHAAFTFVGHTAGTDTITARFVNSQGTTVTSNAVTSTWVSSSTPPRYSAPSAQGSTEGAAANINLGSFTDPNSSPYRITVDWGDGSTTTTFTQTSAGSLGTKSHTYAEEGAKTVRVTVTNGANQSDSGTFTVTVGDPAVVGLGGFTIAAVEGAASAVQTLATFKDPGGAEALADYSASVAWGDGSSSAGSISYNAATQTFTVQGSHTYTEEGTKTITVTLKHDTAPNATVTDTATITDPAVQATGGLTLNSVEPATTFQTQTLATFKDPGGAEALADYSATIAWGDNNTSAGTISYSAANQTFTVMGGHTYAEEGSYTVTVTVKHDSAPNATAIDHVVITDPAVVGTGGFTLSGAEGASTGMQTVATFKDPAGAEALADYSASIDWGDHGTAAAGTISYNAANQTFTVQGSHIYAEEGGYTVTVVLKHDSAPNATVTDRAAITDPAIVGTGGFTVTGSEGAATSAQTMATFKDPGGAEALADYSASIDWGDHGTAAAGTISYNAATQTFTVQGSHTYAEEGRYTITVTLKHDATPNTTVTSTAAIADVAVTGTGGFTVTGSEGANTGTQTVATFKDPAGPEAVADYSAGIAWGDGGTSAGTISYNAANQTFTVQGSHTYAEEDGGTITVTIHHDTAPNTIVTSTTRLADPAVVAQGGQTLHATEGTSLSTILATFTDPGGPELPADYSADIDWGDGSSSHGTILPPVGSGSPYQFDIVTHYQEGGCAIGGCANPDTGFFFVTNTGTSTFSGTIRAYGVAGNGSVLDLSDQEVLAPGQSVELALDGDSSNQGGFNKVTGHPDNGVQISLVGTVSQGGGDATPVNLAVYDKDIHSGVYRTNPFGYYADSYVLQGGDPYGGDTYDDYEEAQADGFFRFTGGSFMAQGNHTYAEEGTKTVTIRIHHESAPDTVVTDTVVVSDPSVAATGGLTVTGTEGNNTGSQTVATFKDPGGAEVLADYAATIDWGDGHTSAGAITYDATAGVFTVQGHNTYAEEGSYDISVTLQHDNTPAVTVISGANVVDAPLTASAVTLSATEGTALKQVVVGTFTDANPQATATDFSATIDWGDGTAVDAKAAVVSDGQGGFQVVGHRHKYADEGSYNVVVIITDVGGSTAMAMSTATVADATLMGAGMDVAATTGVPFQGVVAQFTDANRRASAGDFSATIDWGDSSDLDTTATIVRMHQGQGTFLVQGSHTYDQADTYTITITLTDVGGSTLTLTATATVTDDGSGQPSSGVHQPETPVALALAGLGSAGLVTSPIPPAIGNSSRAAATDAILGRTEAVLSDSDGHDLAGMTGWAALPVSSPAPAVDQVFLPDQVALVLGDHDLLM